MRVPISALLLLLLLAACRHSDTLFVKKKSAHTSITFNNRIVENDSINPLDLEFLYNGGGVVAGDFNNDGLTDLYFTASTESNKLYLNKGDFKFEDVTDISKVTGDKRWSNGASAVDINSDGLLDIYVSTTIKRNGSERANLLYINQGMNENRIPVFKEMAAEYNLADTGYSVHAGFFDYDNDGDLDVYIVQTKLASRGGGSDYIINNQGDTSTLDYDKLYRNDWNESLQHPVFTDVSLTAGIKGHGYGLGFNIADLNKDGWKDIYVTNDFYGSDELYINNADGTFTNKIKEYFKHTSQNAMGNDIADINNDGLADVLAVDMNPEDNYRKKKNMGGNNYFIFQNMIFEGYVLQYVRNTLQLNMGSRPLNGDSTGEPVFADISYYSGIAETDWSWNANIADFDNDGLREIFITNGYPRDVTDHDFAAFRNNVSKIASKEEIIDQMPQIKVRNYAYRNKNGLQFEDVTSLWGFNDLSFSNGAVYADLDNDGDLDYVISNINDEALVYENTLNTKENISAAFLKVKFDGEPGNVNGLGAFATVYYNGNKQQVWENSPYRGYLSCVDNTVLYGLGENPKIDSLVIVWNGNKSQTITDVKVNQQLVVREKDAVNSRTANPILPVLFSDVTNLVNIRYKHNEQDFIDFNVQRLLPHKLSEYGPGLACGDIDNNGYDDIVVGGNAETPVQILLQQKDGRFIQKPLIYPAAGSRPENLGILLFDADGDNDPDLYLTAGSNEAPENSRLFEDRFFLNDGKGNFTFIPDALPQNFTSKCSVKAADFDKDGDMDLFVGGRLVPGKYPRAVSSFIYRNDSKNGNVRFTDITSAVAPELKEIGLICDAIWSDFDNDGWTDLILTGEWMDIRFFRNVNGKLVSISNETGTGKYKGWWNSITAGDFDNDGDIDYIAGNLGQNSYYRGTEQYPVRIYAGDFANNQSYVGIPSLYLKNESGILTEYPAQTRDDVVDQMPALKKKFLTYKDFAKTDMRNLLDKKAFDSAYTLEANYFLSSFIRNDGNGKFTMIELPPMIQMAPVYGMVADDFNGDGFLDLASVGNDYGTEVSVGRYDALNGVILLGDGTGRFTPMSVSQGGVFVPGNAKSLVKLRGADNTYLLAASQNKDSLKVFKATVSGPLFGLQDGDVSAIIHYKNGKKRKEEVYKGTSFISQSASFITVNNNISRIEVLNNKGEVRTVQF